MRRGWRGGWGGGSEEGVGEGSEEGWGGKGVLLSGKRGTFVATQGRKYKWFLFFLDVLVKGIPNQFFPHVDSL